jgi:hypothetical protein
VNVIRHPDWLPTEAYLPPSNAECTPRSTLGSTPTHWPPWLIGFGASKTGDAKQRHFSPIEMRNTSCRAISRSSLVDPPLLVPCNERQPAQNQNFILESDPWFQGDHTLKMEWLTLVPHMTFEGQSDWVCITFSNPLMLFSVLSNLLDGM